MESAAVRFKMPCALGSLFPCKLGSFAALQLRVFALDRKAFISFLSAHQNTLRETKLADVVLQDGTWKGTLIEIRDLLPDSRVLLDGHFCQMSGPYFFIGSSLYCKDENGRAAIHNRQIWSSPFSDRREFGLDFRCSKTREFESFWKHHASYPVQMEEDTQVQLFLAGNGMERIEPSSPYSWSDNFIETRVVRAVDDPAKWAHDEESS